MQQVVTFTDDQQAELVSEAKTPAAIEADEIAGRTIATLISPGTEAALFANHEDGSFPKRPGYAAVFEVEEVGKEVSDIKPGDRVYSLGRHSSHQRCKATAAAPLPDGLDAQAATFARLMGVSMSTLNTTKVAPPAKVLVTGLGPVGNLAAQIFKHAGYDVAATDHFEARRSLAEYCGIARTLERVTPDDTDIIDQVSLGLECSGHEQAVLDAVRAVRKAGEVVLIATPWIRQTDIWMQPMLYEIFYRYVTVRSGWEWEVPEQPTDFHRNSRMENYRVAMDWINEGKVTVDPLFETVSPSDCHDVYERLYHRKFDKLTAVFDWMSLD